jgi:putative sterol carrier protein
MSTIIDSAIAALNEKIAGKFCGNAKFVVEGEGSIMLDNNGARAGDDSADVTLSADVETFKGILDGSVNPTAAFMMGKLTVDGDMGQAIQLGATLS